MGRYRIAPPPISLDKSATLGAPVRSVTAQPWPVERGPLGALLDVTGRHAVRWRRLCVDVAADGQVLNGSIEEYAQIGGTRGFYALRVISPGRSWETPPAHFLALLAEPWDEPELPFPPKGWVLDGEAQGLDDLRRGWEPQEEAVTLLTGGGEEDEPLEF